MSHRVLALAASIALIAASAGVQALAQAPSELIGDYPVVITGTGTGCGPDHPGVLSVTAVEGGKITFEMNHADPIQLEYDSSSMTFRGTTRQSGDTAGISGQFTRSQDTLKVIMAYSGEGCQGRMTGVRPAPRLAIAATDPVPPTAFPAAPTAASEAAAGAPGAPQATPAQPAAPTSAPAPNQLLFYAPLALLLLGGGALGGWLFGRRKGKTDA